MNEYFKKEKERKNRENSSGIIKKPASNQSVRQVAEMALGQLLHVKIDVDAIPVVKHRVRKQSVSDKVQKRTIKHEPKTVVLKKRRLSSSYQATETSSEAELHCYEGNS